MKALLPKIPAVENSGHEVLGPKATGAWNLHALCEDLELFVLFSSVSATIGGDFGDA